MVRKGGLEPPWAAPLEPKSSASTNSATFAAAFAKRVSIADPGPVRQEDARGGPRLCRGNVVLSAHCARFRVSVAHYENFPVASLLVPQALRPAIVAIYRFARDGRRHRRRRRPPPPRRGWPRSTATSARSTPSRRARRPPSRRSRSSPPRSRATRCRSRRFATCCRRSGRTSSTTRYATVGAAARLLPPLGQSRSAG